MDSTFEKRISAIDWTAYQTAYGPADDVANQLMQLASGDKKTSLKASHELWCWLCHQHVQLATGVARIAFSP